MPNAGGMQYVCCILVSTRDLSAAAAPGVPVLPLFRSLLLHGEIFKRARLAAVAVRRQHLTNAELRRIRYRLYRWVATRLGYHSRQPHFECIYALIERYFGASTTGYKP